MSTGVRLLGPLAAVDVVVVAVVAALAVLEVVDGVAVALVVLPVELVLVLAVMAVLAVVGGLVVAVLAVVGGLVVAVLAVVGGLVVAVLAVVGGLVVAVLAVVVLAVVVEAVVVVPVGSVVVDVVGVWAGVSRAALGCPATSSCPATAVGATLRSADAVSEGRPSQTTSRPTTAASAAINRPTGAPLMPAQRTSRFFDPDPSTLAHQARGDALVNLGRALLLAGVRGGDDECAGESGDEPLQERQLLLR